MTRKYERPKIFSIGSHKRLGKHCEYGCSMFGSTLYGSEPITVDFGENELVEVSGIYQRRWKQGKPIYVRERFYFPKYQNTEAQLATRQNMRNAMQAWGNLTDQQKLVYNIRAKGKNYNGYNLFVKEFILAL